MVVDHAAQTNAILAGQVNIASAEDIALSEMPLYVQNAEKAKIRAFTTGSFNWPLQLFLKSGLPIRRPQQHLAETRLRSGTPLR